MSALETLEKQKIINDYQRKPGDTGSSEVQIAILTERIKLLSKHLQAFPKDYHSRRGLMNLVSQRRKLLAYFKRKDPIRYKELIDRLGLRR